MEPILNLMLKHGADINLLDNNGKSILYVFCESEKVNMKLVQILLEKGATDYQGALQGHCKSASLQFEILKLLVELKCDLNAKDYNGESAFHYLLANPKITPEILSYFLDKKADPHFKSRRDDKPIEILSSNESVTLQLVLSPFLFHFCFHSFLFLS